MVRVLGLDIGGANIKWATLAVEHGVFSWRTDATPVRAPLIASDPGAVISIAVPEGPFDAVVLTQTACLAYPDLIEGTLRLFRSVRDTFRDTPVLLAVDVCGNLRDVAEVFDRPTDFVCTNIAATATVVGKRHPCCLLADMGTTSTDLIAISDGRFRIILPAHARLAARQVVYSGTLRTPVQSVLQALPFNGGLVPVVNEQVACTGDAYVVLGWLQLEDYSIAPWDLGPKTIEGCTQRLAKLLAANSGSFTSAQAKIIARYTAECQISEITRAALQIASAAPEVLSFGVYAGLGRRLLAELFRRLEVPCQALEAALGLPEGLEYTPAVGQCLAWADENGLETAQPRCGR